MAEGRVAVNHLPEAPEQERDQAEKVAACAHNFEDSIGREFWDRCNRFFRQYRLFRKFRDEWTKSGPNDRDGLIYDAKRHWGAHLHIPLSFRTIEEQVPAAIAHRPRLLYLPRREQDSRNVQNVRMLVDAQQDNIDIDLKFQAVMRSGRIYGIGFGKTYWRKEYAVQQRAKESIRTSGSFYVGEPESVCTFDDPYFEDIDPWNIFWDPYGSTFQGSGRTAWAIHRIWLDGGSCFERVHSGAWNTVSAKALTEEKLRSMGSHTKYDEIMNERMEASGFGSFQNQTRGEPLHEVWEWHDGNRVLTVLDRSVLVQDMPNPCMGHLPFVAYRPVALQGQMIGIGDLEPLEHLNAELDTLRSQRRDAATLALSAGYAYDTQAIDIEDLVFGPHAAIPVQNQSPRDAIVPLQRQEVPGTSYEEERVIKADAEAISGLSSAMDPNSGGVAGTATEAQLLQASLSRRVQLSSRRFEIEVVRHVARQFLYLNQRMILRERDPMRAPDHGLDEYQAAVEGRWRWFPIGPAELQGEFEIIPEGGSMAARNVQQDRQDALQMMQLFGQNPFIDPRRPLMKALELFGIRDPEAWLKQGPPPVPPSFIEILMRTPGINERLVENAIRVAQQQDPQLAPDQQQAQQQLPQGAPA